MSFLNKYSWLILVIIASVISFVEFNNLINKIWKKKEFSKYFINIISFFIFYYLLIQLILFMKLVSKILLLFY